MEEEEEAPVTVGGWRMGTCVIGSWGYALGARCVHHLVPVTSRETLARSLLKAAWARVALNLPPLLV